MNVIVGSDHAGWPAKENIIRYLYSLGYEVFDVGSFDDKPVDFPDVARELCSKVLKNEAYRGIMICGTGVGASIACNKQRDIRASVVHDIYTAHQCVEHDNVNVMCIGAQIIGQWLVKDLIRSFLEARFSVDKVYRRRVEKLAKLESL